MFKSLLQRVNEARCAEPEDGAGAEAGFTLIELMVVLLIMAILLAIAIPTFLGVSGSAKDRAAQSDVTNAITNAVAYYQNAQTFDTTSGNTTNSQCVAVPPAACASTTTAGALSTAEPSFTWQGAACTSAANPPCVSVAPVDAASANDGQGIIVASLSSSGTCWYALNLQTNPLTFAAAGLGKVDYAATDGAFAGQPGQQTGATTGGTFYAMESGSSVKCSAAQAQGFTKWYSSYAAAVTE